MKTYHASIVVNGVPLGDASSLIVEEPQPHRIGAQHSATFTAHVEGSGSLSVFRDLTPRPTPVTVRMPWGILGSIEFPAWVDDCTLRSDPNGAAADLGLVPDPHMLRRAVAMAVQDAIEGRGGRRGKVLLHGLFAEDRHVRDLAYSAAMKRGQRKTMRAMRRLLRAAGVTKGAEDR